MTLLSTLSAPKPDLQTYRLDTPGQSLVLGARGEQIAQVVYWGPRLGDDDDLAMIFEAAQLDVTGGMLDQNPELSLCPLASRTFPGQSGLRLRDGEGRALHPNLVFVSAQQSAGSLALCYGDSDLGLTYVATLTAHAPTGVITVQASMTSQAPVYLDWLAAPVMPAPQQSDHLIDFSGRWIGEFQMNRVPWTPGVRLRENFTGRTGHEHFPGLIMPCMGATNTGGQAYGMHYAWSGGHRMVAEELPDGRRQVQFGHASGIESKAASQFVTAPLHLVFSDQGLNGIGTAFQRFCRDQVVAFPNADRPRPVHYNCWEAVYFDHDVSELQDIADMAAQIGAERFVLDDGWFKNRTIDDRALGDWVVDTQKYPNGLGPLIDHVHAAGMSFGIWFEPEMLNLDSDVYRAHPDWLLGASDQTPGRQQYVLNIALADVQDYLFDSISDILTQYPIDYIKWDHNRVLPLPDAAQTAAIYALLDRLRAAHPGVEIESCSSGGGRIDFGILARTHRVWLSDSNDAIERLRIQHNAALFLPLVVTGSHVGPRQCHTSGRTLPIEMRAWVAAQRHLGFEMDPRELTAHERDVLVHVTAWWKANREWMQTADILRLDNADPAIIAEQQLAADGSRFVVFAGRQNTSAQIAPRPLRLTALVPDATYRIELANRADASHLSRGDQAIKTQALTLSGQALMNQGVALPWAFADTIWVVEGTRMSSEGRSADAQVRP